MEEIDEEVVASVKVAVVEDVLTVVSDVVVVEDEVVKFAASMPSLVNVLNPGPTVSPTMLLYNKHA